MNLIARRANLRSFREHFLCIAQHYSLRLHPTLSNEEIVAKYNDNYPDDETSPYSHFRFLKVHQPHIREIQ
jgi:hypothetical protein